MMARMEEHPRTTRVKFVVAWALALVAKAWLVATLPAFGDEAFYTQESTRLAWAYSDLPGATAWLIRLGTTFAGHDIVGARLPFLALGALLPWLVVRIARRAFGDAAGWQAGLLATLLPLGGLMGVLALPDVPMLAAALLCVDACAALMRRVGPAATAQLAFALALGALTHYRFALVVVAGGAGLLLAPPGRALLRSPQLWLALAVGAAAWWPLLAWNLAHAGAGVAFQLVDRHPWQPQAIGAAWLPVQILAVTPLLFALLVATGVEAWRRRRDGDAWPFFAGISTVAVGGYFLLGFFADSERVSFHWPLAGWLVLCCAAPAVLAKWRPGWRLAVHATAALGLAATFAWLALVATPVGRERLAATPLYADNFSGWDEVAAALRPRLAAMPRDTWLVADNFMLGAQLALALGRDDVRVLPHPLNDKHGRAVQLADWQLLVRGRADWGRRPVLLVVEDTARPLKHRLDGYRQLCRRSGGLPPPEILNIDHGRKRFLVFVLDAPSAGCSIPALAYLDAPEPAARAGGTLDVRGWALKDGVGVARVDVTLDGEVVATARYGRPRPDVVQYWTGGEARDDDGVGFDARIDLAGRAPGTAWLGLVVHGRDGSVEPWPEQVLRIEDQGNR
jgi:4-amino-4-deoxy-L-arabinose transferase-like glycosyltransferase